MAKVCLQCGQRLGFLKGMADQFCSPQHAGLYREERSELAFERLMRGQAPTGPPAPPSGPRPDFTGQEWAQSASALAQSAAPQTPPIHLPAAQAGEEFNLRKDLNAILQVARPPQPAEEVASQMEMAEVSVGEANAPAPRANVWGKAARSMYFEAVEPTVVPAVAPAVEPAAAPAAVEAQSPATAPLPALRAVPAAAWSVQPKVIAGVAASLSILALAALLAGPLVKPVEAPVLKPRIPVAPVLTRASSPKPAAVKAETPTSSPAAGTSHATLAASDASWVVACADHKVLFAKLFTAGMRESIAFTTSAAVKIGRSNAVQMTLNGHALNGPGGAGQVSLLELTPGGSRPLTSGAPGDCTSGR